MVDKEKGFIWLTALEVLVYVTGIEVCHEAAHCDGGKGGVKPFILWLGSKAEWGKGYGSPPDDLKTQHRALYSKGSLRLQWLPLGNKSVTQELLGVILYWNNGRASQYL